MALAYENSGCEGYADEGFSDVGAPFGWCRLADLPKERLSAEHQQWLRHQEKHGHDGSLPHASARRSHLAVIR